MDLKRWPPPRARKHTRGHRVRSPQNGDGQPERERARRCARVVPIGLRGMGLEQKARHARWDGADCRAVAPAKLLSSSSSAAQKGLQGAPGTPIPVVRVSQKAALQIGGGAAERRRPSFRQDRSEMDLPTNDRWRPSSADRLWMHGFLRQNERSLSSCCRR